MPYIYVDELGEGQEEADVVEQSKVTELEDELETAREQRDEAMERATESERMYQEMRQKYADTFLSKPKVSQFGSAKPEVKQPQSLEELFGKE